MAILKQDLYGYLISSGYLRKLDERYVTRRGGDLMFSWSDARSSAEYFYNSNILDYDNMREALFFVFADYLTYIPYGSAGYKAFEGMLREVDPGISVAQYRFQWLERRMGKRLSQLNDGQRAYVKYYFENYNKREINLKIPAEVVSLICRFHHECEANYGTGRYSDIGRIGDVTMDFSDRLAYKYDDGPVVDAEEFLKEVPPCASLGGDELEYIRKFTGLDEAKK